MRGLMRQLFIFGIAYIYWWCGLLLSVISMIIIFDVTYYLWCWLWLFLTWIMMIFVVISDMSMWCIFYLLIIQGLIYQGQIKQFKVDKKWRGSSCAWAVVFALIKIWVTRIHRLWKSRRRRIGWGSVSVTKIEHMMNKGWGMLMKRVMMNKS